MARTAKTNFMGAELPPFMDFTKMAGDFKMPQFGDFKMPQFDATALIEAQRRNLEAFTAANQLAFEGAKAMTQRQVELMQQVWEESAEAAQTLSTAGKPEEQIAKQAALVKRGFERSVANMRELAEIGAKSNSEAAEVLNRRFAEGLDEFSAVVEKTTAAS